MCVVVGILLMRESTVFYRSFYEAIKELDADTQAQVYSAIFEYALNFNEVELSLENIDELSSEFQIKLNWDELEIII